MVLVNSASAKYSDFSHYIQPYLENFGVPYSVVDISSNTITTNISHNALIIIGHRQIDTNHFLLNATAQNILSQAISNGVGLVNLIVIFQREVSGAIFVQDIFGFGYTNASSAANASFPPTQPGSHMHYITARHPTHDSINFRGSITIPGLTLTTNGTAVALAGGKPLVIAQKFAQGYAVQWTSLDWMSAYILGPMEGLDDEISRGLVWAARKPFVMRSLPHFVTLRMDDCGGPFTWVHIANEAGFKPFLAIFINDVSTSYYLDLRFLVTNNMASASPHSFNNSTVQSESAAGATLPGQY